MADTIEYTSSGKPHPYHLVRPSVWPMVGSIAAGVLAMLMVLFMHNGDMTLLGTKVGVWGPLLGLVGVVAVMFFWWKDVVFEAVTEKVHTDVVKIGFRFGMMLFIASEVMFFVAFFWGFIGAALYPHGGVWPPEGVHTINPFDLPFLMTMILLLSGCTVTWAHHEIIEGRTSEAVKALAVTVGLGAVFLCFQAYEYAHAPFGFKDGIFPSAFFMATGFHGFHVLVGTLFLAVCLFRTMKGHFKPESHFGFEAAAWYWHFVDVVWLFLFVAVYYWGGGSAEHHEVHGLI
ncbi:MAG: cytochrome c oxidase subunit 3 [Alphaproteobacteria bacterium]|nr:cytochrome c oxidase subunit 3 [Alphaproteobacteria bacterium]